MKLMNINDSKNYKYQRVLKKKYSKSKCLIIYI